MGDCLASVLQTAGYDVQREFYVNDAGNQIEKFKTSLEVRYLQIYDNTVEILLEPLTYIQSCPCCNNTNVIRKGSSGNRRVRHLPLCGNKTFLLLPKIRLYCKDCMLNFTFKYSFIDGKSRYTKQYNDNLANAVIGSTVAHAQCRQLSKILMKKLLQISNHVCYIAKKMV